MDCVVLDPLSLIDSSGNGLALDVAVSAAMPANQRGLPMVAYDGTNTQFVRTNTSGQLYADVIDRAGRLLGVIYGSQGQQLKQTPTNYNTQVELATGATLYDARQIRALTSADVVTAAQGTAAALSGKWPVQHTDGTNVQPAMDAVTRRGYVSVTDGTNTLPTMDAIARKAFIALTDGTSGPVGVAPASTAVLATQPALAVGLSPTSPLPTGTNAIGSVTAQPASYTTSGSISANGNILQLPAGANTITQYAGISLEISGTWNATLTLYGSNGGSYFVVNVIPLADPNAGAQANITANGLYWAPLGYKQLVLTASGYVSGTILCYTTLGGDENVPAAGQVLESVTASSYPDQGNYVTALTLPSYQDAFGNLATRGPALTDEGSFRTDFAAESVAGVFTTALTGTSQFADGSAIVIGTGTNYQAQVRQGQYIKLTSDPEADYAQVASINSATSITLVSAYAGTSTTAAAVVSNWATKTPPGGFTYGGANPTTVALNSGTTASGSGYIQGLLDYGPISVQAYATISAAEVNETNYFGLQDIAGATPNYAARFLIGGSASTTTVICETRASANAGDISQTTVTLPNGASIVGTYHLFKIDLSDSQCTFSIDGVVVATSTLHLPSPYQNLYHYIGQWNGSTAPAATVAFTVDMTFFEDVDRLQVDGDFSGEPIPVAGNLPIANAALQAVPVIEGDKYRATYSVGVVNYPIASGATDVAILNGAAGKVVRITRILFSMTATTAVEVPVTVVKRSAANTGGTVGSGAATPLSSKNAAASATNLFYAANPTVGALVGTMIRGAKYAADVATPAAPNEVLEWLFGERSQQPTLYSAAEGIAVNLGGTTIAGGTMDLIFEWTEDTQ